MRRACRTAYRVLLLAGWIPATAAGSDDRIPVFARKYRTSCSTCHTAAPKLNVLGEAFRLNGYRFPENDELLRKEDPVPLGGDPWKELWPRAIWPGDIPATAAVALRVLNDIEGGRDGEQRRHLSYRFPHEVYLLAGATLGESMAAFLEGEWSREEGIELLQAKIKLQGLLGRFAPRAVNLWVGLQNLYLFTFADRQIDRAARANFRWQEFRPSDVELLRTATGTTARSENRFQLRRPQPAIELNGLLSRNLYYGVGLAQGAGSLTADNNNHKDFYYKLRYKLGGLRLDGSYPPGGGPEPRGYGQLRDRSVIVEHFGYFGAEPVAGGRKDNHRALGISLRALYGPLDAGGGYVWRRHADPWGSGRGVNQMSLFGKAEYLVLPWVIGSLKLERFELDLDSPTVPGEVVLERLDQTRVLPGLILLLRQNVRFVAEAELFAAHAASADRLRPAPFTVWGRLDVAF